MSETVLFSLYYIAFCFGVSSVVLYFAARMVIEEERIMNSTEALSKTEIALFAEEHRLARCVKDTELMAWMSLSLTMMIFFLVSKLRIEIMPDFGLHVICIIGGTMIMAVLFTCVYVCVMHIYTNRRGRLEMFVRILAPAVVCYGFCTLTVPVTLIITHFRL
jgi:hypothetical protein